MCAEIPVVGAACKFAAALSNCWVMEFAKHVNVRFGNGLWCWASWFLMQSLRSYKTEMVQVLRWHRNTWTWFLIYRDLVSSFRFWHRQRYFKHPVVVIWRDILENDRRWQSHNSLCSYRGYFSEEIFVVLLLFIAIWPVSYTHLTLPTILLV